MQPKFAQITKYLSWKEKSDLVYETHFPLLTAATEQQLLSKKNSAVPELNSPSPKQACEIAAKIPPIFESLKVKLEATHFFSLGNMILRSRGLSEIKITMRVSHNQTKEPFQAKLFASDAKIQVGK